MLRYVAGRSWRIVLLYYPLRLTILPIISGFNQRLPWLFSGGFLIEMVFSFVGQPAMVTAVKGLRDP